MTSSTGQPVIKILTLPDISRSKANQTMQFAHLVEQDMGNIFTEKS